ncbi:caspase family protein [Caulobacter soli]|uniref:caspase family protein n=1 Tax=Caulobacter soli TaxID=2708539 RepID=UPI0013ED1910|nr:caspase family protein [Caulobacter soli]
MRVLIAIGCNAYDHQNPLTGAEGDAQRIFDTLTRPELGDYDRARSRLLLSPSSGEVRNALREVLFSNGAVDTFTFFFAGHGGVRGGSFYMLVRDSVSAALSFSALSLSDLFLALNEAAPSQSNIIIDACEAGGLISDLNTLLKSNVLGDADTPGVTLVATAAQDQYSGETAAGGFGTNAILDCIEGRALVQDTTSALDLVEIGRHVSTTLRASTDQTPVVWGLNLYGPPRFCRNPRYGADPSRPLREVLQAWPAASDTTVRANYDALWRVYASTSGVWNAREFATVVKSAIAPLVETPEALAGFVERLGAAVQERAQLSDDVFRPALTGAALAVCLMPYLGHELIRRQVRALQSEIGGTLIAAALHLGDDLEGDRFALLARRGGGLADLFYLPLRIANVLGWTAAARWMFDDDASQRDEAAEAFTRVLRLVLTHNSGSVVAMSDAQAPCWAVALTGARELGLVEEAEALAGLLFGSLTDCGGQIARDDIPADKVLNYLLARRTGAFDRAPDLVERPAETTAVLLRAASLLGLSDIFDESMWELDGHAFTAYLPGDFANFDEERMDGGTNLIWTVGHDVFRVADVVNGWPSSEVQPENPIVAANAILSSLLFLDRTPWFAFGAIRAPEITGAEPAA